MVQSLGQCFYFSTCGSGVHFSLTICTPFIIYNSNSCKLWNSTCLSSKPQCFHFIKTEWLFIIIIELLFPTGARGTDLPPPFFSNFLFTNLFSIKFLYFFIISSHFPYFNLFVSIFIQSYVNIKLHVSTLYR